MITRIRFRDVPKKLKLGGWTLIRKGNHNIWRHPTVGMLMLPQHPATDILQGKVAKLILSTQPMGGK